MTDGLGLVGTVVHEFYPYPDSGVFNDRGIKVAKCERLFNLPNSLELETFFC